MSKSNSDKKSLFRRILPYLGLSAVVLGVVIFGSINKTSMSTASLNMNAIAENDYQMTADQISEMYVVANVSSSVELASTDTVSSNYVVSSVMRENGQANANRIDKPSIVDTSSISKGVIHYTVNEGDTLQSIAQDFGLTTTQIRWSNDMQDDTVVPSQPLALPNVPGIVYTVKAGDTFDSIATHYGSNKSEMLSVNDLEDATSPTEGAQIVLPDGVLPESERPEVVAAKKAASSRAYSTSSYTYYGSTSGRENMHVVYENVWTDPGNRMTPGQCVWYAWWWRKHSPLSLGALPDGMMGSANVWASVLAGYGYRVDRIPQVGAVFQTSSGYYGHVGVVIGINPNGSITVREMNYGGRAFVVTESIIPANQVGNFNYIH